MARHPFAAVNLISDPIHGYVELTKRLSRDESGAAGLPDEDVAEGDLLDTAWLQRLRRISQLGPYFHDNSVQTLEGVVDYFNGADYNSSPDGRSHPIHLSTEERSALLAFLRIL